eukprot:272401_1
MAELKQDDCVSSKRNRKRPPKIEDHDIQRCLPECLQLYIINKQVINIADDLKLVEPDVHALFLKYNRIYFDNKLNRCIVQWSDISTEPINMYDNIGYSMMENRICNIYLSLPILQYTSTKDIIETLIHEMIHCYLFLFDQHRYDRSDHGKRFISIMNAINYCTKSIKITVYHYCHKAMDMVKMTMFQCNGICQELMQRPRNNPPGKQDIWWTKHQTECGGMFDIVEVNESHETTNNKVNKKSKKKRVRSNQNETPKPVNKKRRIDQRSDSWKCVLCTYINPRSSKICGMCEIKGTKRT